ncbi:MAG: PepSY domain-containing protein [Alphaproteobacteria bacterium]|nr:PepSY domain-containing protein [Alphaproteobacteria bacterium]
MIVKSTAAAALAAILLAGAAFPAAASSAACRAALQGEALTIAQVSERLTQQGFRDITRIERERSCYEVRAVDQAGRRVRLEVNAATGAVVETRSR